MVSPLVKMASNGVKVGLGETKGKIPKTKKKNNERVLTVAKMFIKFNLILAHEPNGHRPFVPKIKKIP